jgi:hypothetical protein
MQVPEADAEQHEHSDQDDRQPPPPTAFHLHRRRITPLGRHLFDTTPLIACGSIQRARDTAQFRHPRPAIRTATEVGPELVGLTARQPTKHV